MRKKIFTILFFSAFSINANADILGGFEYDWGKTTAYNNHEKSNISSWGFYAKSYKSNPVESSYVWDFVIDGRTVKQENNIELSEFNLHYLGGYGIYLESMDVGISLLGGIGYNSLEFEQESRKNKIKHSESLYYAKAGSGIYTKIKDITIYAEGFYKQNITSQNKIKLMNPTIKSSSIEAEIGAGWTFLLAKCGIRDSLISEKRTNVYCGIGIGKYGPFNIKF